MVLPIIALVSFGIAGIAFAARTAIVHVNKRGGLKKIAEQYRMKPITPKQKEIKKLNEEYFGGGFEDQMTYDEACLILGINEADAKDIKLLEAAHRRVIMRNHPDAGGSEYLASKINEAKDVLEAEIERSKKGKGIRE